MGQVMFYLIWWFAIALILLKVQGWWKEYTKCKPCNGRGYHFWKPYKESTSCTTMCAYCNGTGKESGRDLSRT